MHKDINVNVSGPVQPTSTYKTVVLKGNHSFASQVTEPNTKYVIKHNFDLGGEEITIPEGCLLEFDGGSLSNGTILGQNTTIEAEQKPIFHNIEISGNWNCPNIYSIWFDDLSEENALRKVIALSNANTYNTIIVAEQTYDYKFRAKTNRDSLISLNSNTHLILSGTIKTLASNFNTSSVISCSDTENVIIEGDATIVGTTEIEGTGTGQWNHGIEIYTEGCTDRNIEIKGLTIEKFWGDCIAVSGKCIHIHNCILRGSKRQILSVIGGQQITIENNTISKAQSSTEGMGYGIDCESNNNTNYIVNSNIIVRNNEFSECNVGISVSDSKGIPELFAIENNNFNNCITIANIYENSVIFKNNYVEASEEFITANTQCTIKFQGSDSQYLQNIKISNNYFNTVVSLEIVRIESLCFEKNNINKLNTSLRSSKHVVLKDNTVSSATLSVVSGYNYNIEGNIFEDGTLTINNISKSVINKNVFTDIKVKILNTTNNLVISNNRFINCCFDIRGNKFEFIDNNISITKDCKTIGNAYYATSAIINFGYLGNAATPDKLYCNDVKIQNNIINVTLEANEVPADGKILYGCFKKWDVIKGNIAILQIEDNSAAQNINCVYGIEGYQNTDKPYIIFEDNRIFYTGTVQNIADAIYISKATKINPEGVQQSGTTSNRPTGKQIYVGYQYFDTSLSPARPIYASAINGDTVTWVDATGTTV